MPVPLLVGLAVLAVLGTWFVWRRRVRVPCELDLEATHEHFHAHLTLDGVLIEPGDAVTIRDAPDRIEFGDIATLRSEAEVTHASWLRRKWTRFVGRLEFYELYDVGFE